MTSRWLQWAIFHVLVPLGGLLAVIVNKLRRPVQPINLSDSSYLWPDLIGKSATPPPPSLALTGVYEMAMMGSSVSPDHVQLPEGVEFDPACQGPDGTYFAAIGFGYQSGVRPAWMPASLGYHYLEIVSGVAGVRIKDDPERGTFSCMGRLLLDDWLATMLGKLIGLPKTMCPESANAEEFSRLNAVLKATVPNEGDLTASFQLNPMNNPPVTAADPAFAEYRKFLELPVLSRNAWGELMTIDFGFQFDQAVIQPILANLDMEIPGYPGLPPGQWSWPEMSADRPQAACRVWIPWVMRQADTAKGRPAPGIPRPGRFPDKGLQKFPAGPPVQPGNVSAQTPAAPAGSAQA